MLDDDLRLLIGLLAETDALFVPWRLSPRADWKHTAAVFERRDLFRAHGLPLVGGGTDARRKEHSRRVQRAKRAGLLTVEGRARPTARLTDSADASLRALCNLRGLASAFLLLQLVDALATGYGTNAGYVSEFDILGVASPESRDCVRLENQAAPALARDWLDSHCDHAGRVGYAVTRAGRAALAGEPPTDGGLPDLDEEAAGCYQQSLLAALDGREGWEPSPRASVVIALGAGSWPANAELAQ